MLIAGLTTANAPAINSVSFLGPFQTSAATATEANVQQVLPVAGTVANLQVKIGTAPGSSSTWTFTIRKNGVSTGVTCTVSGGTTCASTSSVSFAAGDLLSLQADPGKSPNNWGSARWSATLVAS